MVCHVFRTILKICSLCFYLAKGAMGCACNELVPRKRSTSWTACLHVGFDDSALLQHKQIGNWRERAQNISFWMSQFDDFFSFTATWWTWNVDSICCARLRPEWARCFGMQVWITHSLGTKEVKFLTGRHGFKTWSALLTMFLTCQRSDRLCVQWIGSQKTLDELDGLLTRGIRWFSTSAAQANWKLARTCPEHFFLDEPIRWLFFVHWHLMKVKCKFNLLCLPAPWKVCLLWHAGLTHSLCTMVSRQVKLLYRPKQLCLHDTKFLQTTFCQWQGGRSEEHSRRHPCVNNFSRKTKKTCLFNKICLYLRRLFQATCKRCSTKNVDLIIPPVWFRSHRSVSFFCPCSMLSCRLPAFAVGNTQPSHSWDDKWSNTSIPKPALVVNVFGGCAWIVKFLVLQLWVWTQTYRMNSPILQTYSLFAGIISSWFTCEWLYVQLCWTH